MTTCLINKMPTGKKKKTKKLVLKKENKKGDEDVSTDSKIKTIEDEIKELRKKVAEGQKAKQALDWSNTELERSVREMEKNVLQLEAGNYELDDSDEKKLYENQSQLNIQLEEQKKWLEHELEEVSSINV